MNIRYLFVPWSTYHQLAQKLAAAIFAHSPKLPDEIIAISRGGLTFGHLLSDLLQIPVFSFAIQSYTDLTQQGEMKITQELGRPIAGKRILLVDDVSDTGKTFIRARDYVKSLHPQEITTIALFYKPHSVYQPDFFARRTDRWIIFPYEVAETIKVITQNLQREGKTKAQTQDFLINLGFREDQVAFVRKHYLSQ
jgi:hypoxanthine phosphoribosyltransferase